MDRRIETSEAKVYRRACGRDILCRLTYEVTPFRDGLSGTRSVTMANRPRFIIRIILSVALLIASWKLGTAQGQVLAATEQSQADNASAAEVSKQAANPLSNIWLMQFQQNNNWVGMPSNLGDRVQSDLQFPPLMSVKLADNLDPRHTSGAAIIQFCAVPRPIRTGQARELASVTQSWPLRYR